MKILLLAPHPFYAHRGTPIAVRLVCEGLANMGHSVDVLTFHEGESVDIPGVSIHRIRRPWLVHKVPIGVSWQKALCDFAMARELRRMLRRARYDLIHAVEESAFLAARTGVPFVFDMDSIMSRQIMEKSRLLWPASIVFAALERWALRRCVGVLAVCQAIVDEARKHQPNVHLLPDVAMAGEAPGPLPDSLTQARGLRFMYVGNLERYQGVDLMLEAFAAGLRGHHEAVLLVVGGREPDIARYRTRAAELGISAQVTFCGPVPVDRIGRVLACADVLVSPRIKGENTPMKVYSYLLSGRPVLATRLPTHTQVLDDTQALLTAPDAASMADGMRTLASDSDLRTTLGAAGRRLAQEHYSHDAFLQRLTRFYQTLPQ